MLFRKVALSVSIVLTLFPAVIVSADPIVITGNLTVGLGTGRGAGRTTSFTFTAPELFVTGFEPDGVVQPLLPRCHQAIPCQSGETSASGDVRLAGIGSAVIGGTTYPLTQYFPGSSLTFTAQPVLIPDTTEAAFALRAPFTMDGNLIVHARIEEIWVQVFSADITGSGIATLNFGPHTEGGWLVESVRYDFTEPIPEPATIALLGTGLAAMFGGVRRARLRSSRPDRN